MPDGGAAPRRPIFQDTDGDPICFWLSRKLHPDVREELTEAIEQHGGQVVQRNQDATYALLSNTESLEKERNRYAASPIPTLRDVSPQYAKMIKESIEHRTLVVEQLRPKGMGGVKAGLYRSDFTKVDDLNLAKYLARKLPNKDEGGRRGTGVYAELMELAQYPEHAWVKRHTDQSWRNRYNKNMVKFDAMIEALIPEENPRRRHNYGYSRLAKVVHVEESEEEEEQFEEEEGQQPRQPSPPQDEPLRGASPRRPRRSVAFAEQPASSTAGSSRRPTLEAPPAKRRRLDSGGNSSGPPQRMARRRPVEEDDEEEDEEEDEDHNSLFSGPEDDFEATFAVDEGNDFDIDWDKPPPKEVVTYDSPGDRRRSSAVRISQQSTLIGSAPVPRMSGGMEEAEEAEPEQVYDANGEYEVEDSEEFEGLEDSPAKPIYSPKPSPNKRKRSELVARSPPVPKPAPQQRPAKEVASQASTSNRGPPPPRMTRSRSQSVEPEYFESLPTNTKRSKGKGKAVARNPSPLLEVLEEAQYEAFDGDDFEQPRLETYEEEQDVLQLVTNYSVGSSNPEESGYVDDGPVIVPPANARLPSRSRSASMESDDVQILAELGVKNIRPQVSTAAPVSKPRKPRTTVHGDSIAARARSTYQATPRFSLPPPKPSSRTPRQRGELFQDLTQWPREAASDASSTDSFPLKNTGASAYKHRVEEEMKSQTFSPIPGTRAYESSQRSQRSRAR